MHYVKTTPALCPKCFSVAQAVLLPSVVDKPGWIDTGYQCTNIYQCGWVGPKPYEAPLYDNTTAPPRERKEDR